MLHAAPAPVRKMYVNSATPAHLTAARRTNLEAARVCDKRLWQAVTVAPAVGAVCRDAQVATVPVRHRLHSPAGARAGVAQQLLQVLEGLARCQSERLAGHACTATKNLGLGSVSETGLTSAAALACVADVAHEG